MFKRYINYIIKINIVYSAIINFRYFGWNGLLKMPIMIHFGSTIISESRNGIKFSKPLKRNMLTVERGTKIEVVKGGLLQFNGNRAYFNKNNNILVSSGGTLEIGHNFWVNSNSEFYCRKGLKFGDDVLVAFHVLFLDTDYHPIFDERKMLLNPDRKTIIGNKVWIGCNVTVLKGAHIGNNIVVGAGSLVTGNLLVDHSIYFGNPIRHKKKYINWYMMHQDF